MEDIEKKGDQSDSNQYEENSTNSNDLKRKRSKTEKKFERYKKRIENYKAKKQKKKRLKQEQTEKVEPELKNIEQNYEKFLSKRQIKEKIIERLNQVYTSPENSLKICIDCSFSDKMSSKEMSRLAQQIGRCYATNKSLESPVHFTLCNLESNSNFYKELCRVNDGFDRYILEKTNQSLIDRFCDKKESICYLSPDSEDYLEDIDADQIYVIGGLVDETIKSCALPIEKYLTRRISDQDENRKFNYNKILAVNQVFNILAYVFEHKDWIKALDINVPKRKGFMSSESL
ncbi:tRNA methyltransferase 10 -like protein [Brachionus plicatilis]|uniref:tRNA methyltransferase 10-like protein n=1 Tax=Brachionus plicatilis TaxID=10195 RepID=A0A3M7P9Q5_BRAPC|nr:tRNA methyltransferase 10 -like protein [Brachionus plicatilis]